MRLRVSETILQIFQINLQSSHFGSEYVALGRCSVALCQRLVAFGDGGIALR
jgi:hypothetical protein